MINAPLSPIAKMLQNAFGQPEKAQDDLLQELPKMYFKFNRLKYTSGDLPPPSPADQAEAQRIHAEILADLWCGENLISALSYAEMRCNLLKILLALYGDCGDFQAAETLFHDAIDCLSEYNNNPKNQDPIANRKHLAPFEDWLDLLLQYAEFVPEKAFEQAVSYNTGLQIINYYNRLMNYDANFVAAAFRVIHGASLESVAVKHQISQATLRKQTLLVGQMLYRIGFITEVYTDMQAATSIPQIRAEPYKKLADLDELKFWVNRAKTDFCEPFEKLFGVSQMDWQKFAHQVAHGDVQIRRKLNCE